MIIGVTIRDLKGFESEAKLHCCPITLVFHRNITGTRAALHGLHSAPEVFDPQNEPVQTIRCRGERNDKSMASE